jgi:D-beta-D-heptose 7-phosphate kinase/D-beta-D-heptose 1-phosphate adenosyltransferase
MDRLDSSNLNGNFIGTYCYGLSFVSKEKGIVALSNLIYLNMDVAEKIVGYIGLDSLLEHWRALGDRIVFTNGCFDILHLGHVTLLNHCATLGDRVVVGLNSDSSVKKLKGDSRPVNNQDARAMILASLENVDAVIIFNEDTPIELIKFFRPDVLVKGGDYKENEIVGADVVKANGGSVKIVPLVSGLSTTHLIESIK